jgi:hypothetical protein
MRNIKPSQIIQEMKRRKERGEKRKRKEKNEKKKKQMIRDKLHRNLPLERKKKKDQRWRDKTISKSGEFCCEGDLKQNEERMQEV